LIAGDKEGSIQLLRAAQQGLVYKDQGDGNKPDAKREDVLRKSGRPSVHYL